MGVKRAAIQISPYSSPSRSSSNQEASRMLCAKESAGTVVGIGGERGKRECELIEIKDERGRKGRKKVLKAACR
jgi:hypothetical protein